ncbi:hypothetical protein FRC07_006426, partial [Ceratobasidium sp. 392]
IIEGSAQGAIGLDNLLAESSQSGVDEAISMDHLTLTTSTQALLDKAIALFPEYNASRIKHSILQTTARFMRHDSEQEIPPEATEADLLHVIGIFCGQEYEQTRRQEYLDMAIECYNRALLSIFDNDPHKRIVLDKIGAAYIDRFESLDNLSDLHSGIRCFERAISLTQDGHADKPRYRASLGKALIENFERLGDLSDLNAALAALDQAASLLPDKDPSLPIILVTRGNA